MCTICNRKCSSLLNLQEHRKVWLLPTTSLSHLPNCLTVTLSLANLQPIFLDTVWSFRDLEGLDRCKVYVVMAPSPLSPLVSGARGVWLVSTGHVCSFKLYFHHIPPSLFVPFLCSCPLIPRSVSCLTLLLSQQEVGFMFKMLHFQTV